jgi:hypothetical protein
MIKEDEMVAPTPSLTFGVDLGDLPKNVQDIKAAIGTPPPGTNIVDTVQATNKQLGKVDFNDVANNARTAATSAQAAETVGNSLANSIGISKPGTRIADTIDAMNAAIGAPGAPGSIADNVQLTKAQLGTVDFNLLAGNASTAASQAGAAADAGNKLIGLIGDQTKDDSVAFDVRKTLNKVKDVDFGSVAKSAGDAAIAAQGLQATFSQVIGTSQKEGTVAFNADSTWQKLKPVDFTTLATKDDITELQKEICELRSLVCRCWWHDVSWVYLDRGETDSAAVKVFDAVGFRDETRRAGITREHFEDECQKHGMQDLLPRGDHFDKLLQFLKGFTGKPPGAPPHSPGGQISGTETLPPTGAAPGP